MNAQRAIQTFEELTAKMVRDLHAHAYENGPNLEDEHLSYEYLVPSGAREKWRAEVKKRWIGARELRAAVERKRAEPKPTYRRETRASFLAQRLNLKSMNQKRTSTKSTRKNLSLKNRGMKKPTTSKMTQTQLTTSYASSGDCNPHWSISNHLAPTSP